MDSNFLISLFAFTIFILLWITFFAALLFKPGLLGDAWKRFRSWPVLLQLLVAFLTLPVVLGLWIWQARWPYWLRLLLVAGLAWFTIYTFFPA